MATVGTRGASTASSDIRAPGALSRLRSIPYLAPCLVLYGLFVVWPVLHTCWLALQRWNGYGPETFVGPANFRDLFADSIFRTALEHSVLWEIAAALIPTLAGLGLALLASRSRARPVFLTLLFFPALLPPTVVAAVWVLIYSPVSGPLNAALQAVGLGSPGWLGDAHLALPALFVAWMWSAIGISTAILWVGLSSIGREYVELALVEGAGASWRFRHITLPALRRIGVIVVLINAALAAQVFDLIFVTTGGGPGYATMILPLDAYGRAFGGHTGQGAAAGSLQVLLGVLLAGLAFLLRNRSGESFQPEETSAGMVFVPRPRVASTLALGLIAVTLLLPLLWLLVASIEPGRTFSLGVAAPGLDPRHWAWDNFATVWNGGMGGAILTSVLLAVAVVAATLILAAPAAFALHRLRSLRWRSGLLALFLIGLLQPTPVLIIPLFSLLKDLGLLDSAWGIALPEIARNLPFAVLVLWGFLAQIQPGVLDAAAVDGAGPFQQMVWVALPLVRPGLYAVAIWSFVSSWNEYLLPTLVSQSGSVQTVPTLLASYIGRYDTQYELLAAAALMAMLPSLFIYTVLRRPAAPGLARVERGVS